MFIPLCVLVTLTPIGKITHRYSLIATHWICFLALVAFCRKASAQPALLIPFTFENDLVIVSAAINGGPAVDFLFDTGSEFTILTEPLLFGLLNAERVEPVRLVGSDLSVAVTGALSRRNRLRVGDLDISGQPIIAIDSELLDLSEIVGRDVFGIVGIGAFGAYVLEIDYTRRVISLTPPDLYKRSRRATDLPLVAKGAKPYVSLATRVHPGFGDTLLYLIDTGAALEAMIYAEPTDSAIYPPQMIAGAIGHGLGGNLIGFVGRTDTIQLGNLALTGIVTHFQVAGDSLLRDSIEERNGVLGNGLLSRFHVAIDFPAKQLHLTPERRFRRQVPYDRSGLKVADDGSDPAAVRVQFVSPGTPASEAGARAGDLIRRVNGWPVRLLSTEAVQRKLRGKVGRRMRLTLVRAGRDVRIAFVLRELI